MRFLQLELRAYGPFRDAPPIDFGDGLRLHVIQGPNEAGKSTTLRAIRALLFGFPRTTGDVHDREYKELRVAATIRGNDGSTLAFTRRKADVKPLWTIDDSQPIAAGALAPYLGGLSESRFNDLFAMNHAELVEGGREIIDGKGDLGAILFAAGSGLARFDQVRRSIEAELDGLFRPKASNPSINASLATLKAARDEETRSMLPTQKWADLHAELLREIDQRAQADAKIRAIERKKRESENLLKALPVIQERERVLTEIDGCKDVVVLSPGFAELRLKTSVDRQAALTRRDEASLSIEKSRSELGAFGPADPVLDEAEAIGELEVGRKLYSKTCRDRQAKQVKLGLIRDLIVNVRSDLLPARPEAEADEVRAIVGRRDLIRELTAEHARLAAKAQSFEDSVNSTIASHPDVLESPNDPAAIREAEAMTEALRRVGLLGDLDAHRLEAVADLAEADRAARAGLGSLPLWSGTLDDLLTLKVPMTATLDRSELSLRQADEAAHRSRSAVDQAEAEASSLDVEIARFRLEGEVPTLEELGARRSDRDLAWRSLREQWLAGGRPDDRADAFESRIVEADVIADRLRLEAGRVARQAGLLASRRELADRIVGLEAIRDREAAHGSSLEAGWRDLWAPTGLVPLSPREMKEWATVARASVVRQAEAVARAREKLGKIEEKIEASRLEVRSHLDKIEKSSRDDGSLAALIARARSKADRVVVACRLDQDRAKLARAEADVEHWRMRWAAAVDALGLGIDVSANRANAALDGLLQLIKAFEDQNSLVNEITELERSENLFIEDLRVILARLDLPASAAGVEADARALKARLDQAKLVDARRLAASGRLDADRVKLDRALVDLANADAALATLAAEAGCASPDDLRAAEQASNDAKSLRARLVELDRQVATLASPLPADRFLIEAQAINGECLKIAIDDQAAELEPIVEARTGHDQKIGGLNQRLESLSVDQKAADARQSVHQSLARLSTDVDRYARLKLASAVLKDAVERHRKRNQGPVLDRAGALFKALTAGSFAGLRDDLDDAGKPRLRGVRGDGSTLLDVEAMSEGTADQLYLALRLASLGAYLDDHEPMPLVVDDILVNFDDVRARAALRALAELAGRTQVLFFTHHDHLVDLARDVLDPASLVVHRLRPNSGLDPLEG